MNKLPHSGRALVESPFLRLHASLQNHAHEIALVLIAVVWGATFSLIQVALKDSGPLFLVGTRFLFASLLFGLISFKSMWAVSRADLRSGWTVGSVYCLVCVLQAYGLQDIQSSTSAFISAMYVPLVPLAQWLLTSRRPGKTTWASTGIAFLGVLLLAGPSSPGGQIGIGELLTLASAVATAFLIVLISRHAHGSNARRSTVIQLFVMSMLSYASMPLLDESIPKITEEFLGAVVALGLASALINLTMNWAQQRVDPSRATVIYATEPIWAGCIGWAIGEHFTVSALMGAALIFLAVIVCKRSTQPDR